MAERLLWQPPLDGSTRIERYAASLPELTDGRVHLDDPSDLQELWRWSVSDLGGFWGSLWRHFDLPRNDGPVLVSPQMPGACWFPGARLNYAEVMLRLPGRADEDVVLIGRSEARDETRVTAAELRAQVAETRAGLIRVGVVRGDRVAAYAPNVPETLVLLLAAASLGAVFTSCPPEFGVRSTVDRLSQVEPVLLLVTDGYRYANKPIHRRDEVAEIVGALPSVRTVLRLRYLPEADPAPLVEGEVAWEEFGVPGAAPGFDEVEFDHPLYVLFSSGTTGLPKPIVHGHGGITLEHLKALALHNDLGPEDTFFWFSTTGWMMWNFLISGLGVGSTVVLLDGDPMHPSPDALWQMAAELGVTFFGASAPYLLACRKAGMVPREVADLSALRAVGSTGAPLPAAGFEWVYDAVGDVLLTSVSGGTDVCTAFVGGAPTAPVRAGVIPTRFLGCAVEAYDESGRSVVGEQGELVITAPMPSMPVGFFNDHDGSRYREAYFDTFPGVWRHGDWVTIFEDGSCEISGRSDATLNRGGVRLGTTEFYAVVEELDRVADSLVVHLEDDEGGPGRLLLFVSLAEGATEDGLAAEIARELRSRLSPRHVPDELHVLAALPRTLTGKKLEVPVKRILTGADPDKVVARGAISHPDVLAEFARLA
ncbi:acetoacetate--CoA ligase [Nocardioides limicola]|uniref:acetoacetate--CoA ligase n=1 Tax=Nocardioides limicola TaxID=2803368 RepID=UPI00193B670D|nr:acetoacetate--CoA ligase [Nocardioides sp. DJM-14]